MLQEFLNVVEFGMNPQEAVAHPRHIVHSFPAARYPYRATNELGLEAGYSKEVAEALEAKGHKIAKFAIFGNANMTVIDQERGIIMVGSDPRGENLGMAW